MAAVRRRTKRQWKDFETVEAILAKPDEEITEHDKETIRKLHIGNGAWSMQFFTAPMVAHWMVEMLDIQPASTVLDPACGISPWAKYFPPGTFYYGWEIQHREARLSQMLYPQAQITCTDAYEHWPLYVDTFDYLIANPPFGLPTTYSELHGLGLSNKRPKSEAAFLEMAVKLARPGGHLAIIVPNSICSNRSTQYIRDWILEQCYLRASVSLPSHAWYFSGTASKVEVLFLQKKPCPADRHHTPEYQILMAVCEHIGWDTRGRLLDPKCSSCGKPLDGFPQQSPFEALRLEVVKCPHCGELAASSDLAIILHIWREHQPQNPMPDLLPDIGMDAFQNAFAHLLEQTPQKA